MKDSEQLASRFARMAEQGLVDVKFDLNCAAANLECACSEVNALYDAVDCGQTVILDFGDSHRK